MAGNIITWNEALDLAGKLLNEETPVHASSFSPSGLRARVRGFIDSITDSNGLVVSSVRPPSDAVAWMAVPLRRRDATCYFGDKRDFAEVGREELSPTYGDTVLAFHFQRFERPIDSVLQLVKAKADPSPTFAKNGRPGSG